MVRLDKVCKFALQHRVRLMVDAEQSYFQPAIDYITLQMMRRYNIATSPIGPIVYTTYQMYLRDGLFKLKSDLERAQRPASLSSSKAEFNHVGGFLFAAKLVRGAYLNSEKTRSSVLALRDPIQPTPQHTHDAYDQAVAAVLEHAAGPRHRTDAQTSLPRIGIVVATHNSRSIEAAIKGMVTYGIHPQSGVVAFAQLLGTHS
jgi:proline dehydrogenase